jgi:hypothetical protein
VPSARPRLAEAADEFYPSHFRRIAVQLAMRRGRMRSRMNSAEAARPRGATCRELIGCIHIGSPSFLNTRWLCDIPNEAMVTVFRNLSDNWLEAPLFRKFLRPFDLDGIREVAGRDASTSVALALMNYEELAGFVNIL